MLFSKYAYAPNLLHYCGPKETEAIFENIVEVKNKNFEKLLLQFNGAVPYLQLIASANNIRDIFDLKVVEAYWLGNDLLKKVPSMSLYHSIKDRFKKRVKIKEWDKIAAKPIMGAKPFHAFHVFDIGRLIGLINLGQSQKILETMDKCRIGWGKIKHINLSDGGEKLSLGNSVVEYFPLQFDNLGKLKIGAKKDKKLYLLDQKLKIGDDVAIHWDFVCDKVSLPQKRNLIFWTNYHLNLANREF